ncbi:MAG: type II secretion system protein [Synergistaceae bacterium]|nr:type II secretion system protein [Synergistaceae bacterium]
MKKNFKRKGFTLVELLIVIVVIGVLSAMMMLSSTEAVSSARASNIVAGLTTFKKALTQWYIDNYDKVYKENGEYKLKNVDGGATNLGALMANNSKLVTKYIGNSSQFKFSGNKFSYNTDGTTGQGMYRFEDSGQTNNRKSWFVGYALSASEISSGVPAKLVAKTKSLGLLANQGTTGTNDNNGTAQKADIKPYEGGSIVWLKVLDLE